jgi:hypothetical protein
VKGIVRTSLLSKKREGTGVELTERKQSLFTSQNKMQKVATRTRFVFPYNIGKHNKAFLDTEFVKEFMLDVAVAVSSGKKEQHLNMSVCQEERLWKRKVLIC